MPSRTNVSYAFLLANTSKIGPLPMILAAPVDQVAAVPAVNIAFGSLGHRSPYRIEMNAESGVKSFVDS